jgi:hypothetical protein
MDERLFWKTMNPARLHALYDTWFPLRPKATEHGSVGPVSAGGKTTRFVDLDVPAGNEKSLAQYFIGR